jgi:hypothetical protein
MKVCVTINCNDKPIKVNINKIIKYEYFNKILSNFNTKMICETIEKLDTSGNKYLIDVYSIPYISIECSSNVFNQLLGNKLRISAGNYSDSLIEFLVYNDMLQMGCTIDYNGWGFDVKSYFDIVDFIKSKLPHLNVFEVISNGGMNYSELYIAYAFSHYDNLDNLILQDLLEYISDYIIKHKYNVSSYDYVLPIYIIKSIRAIYKIDPIGIKNKINSQAICKMLENYISSNYYWCTSKCDNCIHNLSYGKLCKHIDKYNKSNVGYIRKYNDVLDHIFTELKYLHDMKLINLEEIGNITKYKVYN